MALGTKTVAIVLVGGTLLAAVILYSAQDRIGETGNTIMQMISSEAKDNQMHPNDDKEFLKITEWWQASSILKWDWEKPPEYMCRKIEKRGNWIWNDWSFDDAMGAIGCEVHSFDPSIGKKSFNRSNNVHFHDLGLSGNDSDSYVPTKDIYVKKTTTWKIRRLKTIMKMLGHTNRHLDVLKIDIETSEWPAVKDMAASGMFSKVRQFAVEWHLFPTYPSRSEYVGIYAGVMAMKKQGLRTFRAVFHGKDYRDKTFRFQADVNYVNTLYKGM
ncbi:probable methyltransferase-like protein 24 isoform X2 [Haliotis cracherodii]|uniref:probable methyltransferase-like protein 24 isoform X2 n=1 Tax=Haliotis cracherodii TaxID=6455 RepID=UPI0039ED7CB0